MSHEFVMGAGGVPVGVYPLAEFLGTEDFSNEHGNALKLKFRIIGGECDAQEATRICSLTLSQKSNLGKFAVALAGRPIAIGETFRFTDVIGVRGSLVVEATDNGGTRVATFFRQQAPAAPPPPPPPAAPPPPLVPQPAWRPEAPPPPVAPTAAASPSAAELEQFRRWQETQSQATEVF